MKKLLGLFAVALLTSCAGSTQFTQFAPFAGKDAVPPTALARIFVLRPTDFASSLTMKVYCNTRLVGKTGPKSFLGWDVEPGEYMISTIAENKVYLPLSAKAGETYYIQQTPKVGFVKAQVALELMDAHIGQPTLDKLQKPRLRR